MYPLGRNEDLILSKKLRHAQDAAVELDASQLHGLRKTSWTKKGGVAIKTVRKWQHGKINHIPSTSSTAQGGGGSFKNRRL